MKKGILLFVIVLIAGSVSAQVFNTAQTLKKGNFSVGVEPLIITNGGTDFMLFGHIGYGLQKGIDVAAKFGVLGPETYIGADLEVALNRNLSLSGGAHVWNDFGLDGTLLGTFDVAKNVDIYGGLDVDVNFGGNVFVPLWIPVGVEVELNGTMAFILEAEIGLTDSAPHIIGGGVVVYF